MDSSTLSLLLSALALVESSNDPSAHNRAKDARGLLQIRACVIADVNRILGRPAFTHDDAWNPEASRRIAIIYLNHYARHYKSVTGSAPTISDLARIWNGGPRGPFKHSTLAYGKRVASIVERLQKEEDSR